MRQGYKEDGTVVRRLLLAKQLYQHAMDHSLQQGAINKASRTAAITRS